MKPVAKSHSTIKLQGEDSKLCSSYNKATENLTESQEGIQLSLCRTSGGPFSLSSEHAVPAQCFSTVAQPGVLWSCKNCLCLGPIPRIWIYYADWGLGTRIVEISLSNSGVQLSLKTMAHWRGQPAALLGHQLECVCTGPFPPLASASCEWNWEGGISSLRSFRLRTRVVFPNQTKPWPP